MRKTYTLNVAGVTRELPLCPVLARMEQAGFLVDRKALYDFGESLTSSIEQLQQSIWALAGEPFIRWYLSLL